MNIKTFDGKKFRKDMEELAEYEYLHYMFSKYRENEHVWGIRASEEDINREEGASF